MQIYKIIFILRKFQYLHGYRLIWFPSYNNFSGSSLHMNDAIHTTVVFQMYSFTQSAVTLSAFFICFRWRECKYGIVIACYYINIELNWNITIEMNIVLLNQKLFRNFTAIQWSTFYTVIQMKSPFSWLSKVNLACVL